MKKFINCFIFFLLGMGFVFSQSITVTSPNGGQNWELGSTHNVTWTSSGITGNVGIKLFLNGASRGYVAENISVSAGTYSWSISNVIGVGPISTGTTYQIQVKQSGVAGDLSDANFEISAGSAPPAASITVTSPGGGENWNLGSAHNITWTSSGVTGNVGIKLFQNGSSLGYVAENIPVSDGTYPWTISNIIGVGPISTGSNYQIQVKKDGVAGDLSSGNFSIASTSGITFDFRPMVATLFKPHSIKVVEPNGGRDLALNSRIRILWKPKNLTNNVRILLMKGRATFGIITEDLAPGRISHEWTVGRTMIKTALPGSGFRIKIEEQGVNVSDLSDRSFSIEEAKHVDLSCYISGRRSTDYGRKVVLTVKVRINNIGREVLRDVPVRVTVKNVGASSGDTQTKTIPEVTYRGHSYEYSLNFTFRIHGGSRYADRRLMDRTATVVVDPDDLFRDRRRINNTSTYNFPF